jgi:type VI secretion system protein VasD
MKFGQLCMTVALAASMAGCASGPGSLGAAALEATGLRKPAELPDAQKPPRLVALRLHAADKLNVDAKGRPLALVARIYTLRHNAAFERAPYAAFLNPQAEKEALGDDLIGVREVMLVPGQRYEASDKVAREAGYVGVVALFHSPAAERWRASFPAAEAERTGVTVGLHACALWVGAGAGATTRAPKMLSSVRCQ